MATNTLEILGAAGHLSLRWDPDDPDEVANARKEFAVLKEQGYAFFAAERPVEALPAGRGRLAVKRVEPEEVLGALASGDLASAPIGAAAASEEPPKRRRGRPPKSAAAPIASPAEGTRVVATRPMRGG